MLDKLHSFAIGLALQLLQEIQLPNVERTDVQIQKAAQ